MRRASRRTARPFTSAGPLQREGPSCRSCASIRSRMSRPQPLRGDLRTAPYSTNEPGSTEGSAECFSRRGSAPPGRVDGRSTASVRRLRPLSSALPGLEPPSGVP